MELINPNNLTLDSAQFNMLLPYLILLAGGMLVLLLGVTQRFADLALPKFISVLSVGFALFFILRLWGEPSTTLFNKMLAADQFSNFFNVIFLLSTLVVLLSSFSYLKTQEIEYGEYYSLVLFACLGMMLLASSLDLVVLFVALEIMSIAVYVLVGFNRRDTRSNEAALKYYVLGSVASAVFLYGVALVYGATGTMHLQELVVFVKSQTQVNSLFLLGTSLIAMGFLFKVAAVPFHMWMPDVYEGAPTTVTNFMTTGLKAAAFAALLRLVVGLGILEPSRPVEASKFHSILWVVAVMTMVLGNVVALTQRNLKRMLAYSSISHTGYLLVGIIAGVKSESGYAAVLIYLVAYAVMNLGAFSIAAHLTEQNEKYGDIHDLAGLGFKRPFLGFAMMIFMFSMAGVPPTAGFIGKYLMFSSAVQSGEVLLTVIAVLCSAVSAYYYLRIIVIMYMREPIREFPQGFTWGVELATLVTMVATIQMGVFPSELIGLAQKAAQGLAIN